MGIRSMFDHKYPITNLHELDLTFMHDDIDKMIALLESWEEIIIELQKGLETLSGIDARVTYLESLTSGLNKAYSDIEALKKDNANINEQLRKLKEDFRDVFTTWNQLFDDYVTATNSALKAEKTARIQGDFDLDAKIYSLTYHMNREFQSIWAYLEQIIPDTIYNPGCGKRLGFDANTRTTYVHLRDRGLTIAELKQRHLTVEDIADKYECWKFACKGRDLFKYIRHLYSPVNGKLQSFHQIYSDIIGRLYNSATNDDVIDSNMSVQDLIDLNMTCGEMLTHNF